MGLIVSAPNHLSARSGVIQITLTEAQRLDTEYYNYLWQHLFEQGQITLSVPSDEAMWQEDLGRSLYVTFEWLGCLKGKRVLELGCGPGDYTVMLARRGAQVTVIDIAPASLQLTSHRVRANQVAESVTVSRMAAESLAFATESFDVVIGFGLLHHANPVALAPHLKRVLKPGGRAIFREPLGANPLLQFIRNYVPYRQKHRSPNENPLRNCDIEQVAQYFHTMRRREFYLLSMISRAIGSETSFPILWALDEFLIRHLPLIRPLCRYILIEYRV